MLLALHLRHAALLAAALAPLLSPTTSAEPDGCWLEEREGIRVLHLAGTNEERGEAEGFHLADEIQECFEEFVLGYVTADRPALWDLVLRPGILLRFSFSDEDRAWARAVVKGMERARGGPIALEAIDRDLSFHDVLAFSAVPDLEGWACSSLAAWDDATNDGRVLACRNLDYPSTPSIEEHQIVKVHAPDGARAGWIGIGWPGSAGCLTGLSDRGVFVAIHDVVPQTTSGSGRTTPRALALEELVESLSPGERTGAAALAALRAHRFAMGANVLVAWDGEDARGAVVLEVDSDDERTGGVTLRDPGTDATFIACSNDHVVRSEDLYGCDRREALRRGAKRGGIDVEAAWELLEDSGMSITLHRCVALPAARTLLVQKHAGGSWGPVERFVVPEPGDHR
ncbi:MAG: hypothetical protein AAF957_07400 [Planctomycetota bacterium]